MPALRRPSSFWDEARGSYVDQSQTAAAAEMSQLGGAFAIVPAGARERWPRIIEASRHRTLVVRSW
jgi:hypothetical protein